MVYLITGNTGAGKTTYAQQLKKMCNGIVFSIDHWNKTLFLDDKTETDGVGWFLERITRSDEMIQSLVLQLHTAETPAILDLGFAKQERRTAFYEILNKHKVAFELHLLDVPSATRKRRVQQRNAEKGDTYQFEVSDQDFDFMETWFEPLTEEEKSFAKVIL